MVHHTPYRRECCGMVGRHVLYLRGRPGCMGIAKKNISNVDFEKMTFLKDLSHSGCTWIVSQNPSHLTNGINVHFSVCDDPVEMRLSETDKSSHKS